MTRVVVAGLGDTGVLTAVHLARRRPDLEVVGVSPAPGLVSGQELGLRIARPETWSRHYRIRHDDFRGLRGLGTVHGSVVAADLAGRHLDVETPEGPTRLEYDVLVVATGVANGFWRDASLRSWDDVAADLDVVHRRVADAGSLAVVGGGAAAVSAAVQVATRWPEKGVALFHPGERALPRHHPRVWRRARQALERAGVVVHPGRRAELPSSALASGPVRWTTGQPDTAADLVLYAVGRVRPHTGWLPADVLDEDGFVRTGRDLQVPGVASVFAIGDVAATDPLRSSARNFTHRLLAHNIDAHLSGRPLRRFRPPRHRWGAVLGPLPQGYDVFSPGGRRFRVPAPLVGPVLQRLITHRGIYGGVRRR